jgi:hypothetical protein
MSDAVVTLDLQGDFVGGIKAAQAAFVSFGGTTKEFDKRVKSLRNQKLAEHYKSLKTPIVKADKATAGLAESQHEGLLSAGALAGGISGLVSTAGQFAAQVGSAAVRAVLDLATAMGKGILSAAEWGAKMRNSLTALAGGDAKKAEKQLALIRDVAKSTAGSLDDSAASFLEFSKAGFGDDWAKDLAKIKADADTIGLGGAVDSLKDINKGAPITVAAFDDLAKLAGGGENLASMLDLPKGIEKDATRLQAELNKIAGPSFAKRFVNAAKSAGKLGEISKGSKGIWEQLGSEVEIAFSDAFSGIDLKPLKDALGPAIAALGPALKSLAPAVQSVVGAVAGLIGWLSRADNVKAFGDAFEAAKPALLAVGAGLGIVAAASAVVLAGLAALTAVAVGVPLAALGTAATWASSAMSALGAQISSAMAALAPFAGAAQSAGSAIVGGLIQGLTSGAGAIGAAMQSLAQTAIGSFKGALGIASPSKVFAGLGEYVSEGAAVGIDSGAPAVQSSADDMLRPMLPAGGSTSTTNAPVTINMYVSSAEAGATLEQELTSIVRRLNLGGA